MSGSSRSRLASPLITLSAPSVSNHLSLEEAVVQLSASPQVDGIAQFGSRAMNQADGSSDYDLLLLVKDVPTRVFQMVTSIDGRLADIVLVETETADQLLAIHDQPKARSFEALFAQKMQKADILYDASERLHQVRQLVTSAAWIEKNVNNQTDSELYSIWFWQSFGLLHLERMSQSQDRVHQSAVDMMLTACLSATWRSYFDLRGLIWEGEKAAVRYWAEHDKDYLQGVRNCLESRAGGERLSAYRELVERTLEPIGRVFGKGETAVLLANPASRITDVQRTLRYWDSLFG